MGLLRCKDESNTRDQRLINATIFSSPVSRQILCLRESCSAPSPLPWSPLRITTVVAADSLVKRDVFRLPDPFAVITVDGEQTHTTSVIKKTLNPYWNENFDMYVHTNAS